MTTRKETQMDENSAYSFAVSNANSILKTVFYLMEIGNENRAAEMYLDYLWWMEWAKDWIKYQQ